AGNMLTTESHEAYRLHRMSRSWDHNCVYRFPPYRIGHSEDNGFQDGRVFVEDFFDFGAIDVLAAKDDHILNAIDEENIALSIHTTEVSAMIPPMTQGVGGLLGFVPVALHDIGATDNNLAKSPRWQVVTTGSDNPDIDTNHGLTARAHQVAL